MAHSLDDHWRRRDSDTWEVWKRREAFLEAASRFRPDFANTYFALHPAALAAAEESRAERRNSFTTWHAIVATAKAKAGNAPGMTVSSSREFENELRAWATRWRLSGVASDSARPSDWVLELAAGNLCNTPAGGRLGFSANSCEWLTPLPPSSIESRAASVLGLDKLPEEDRDDLVERARNGLSDGGFRFYVGDWRGDETPREWLGHALERIEAVLRLHLEARMGEIPDAAAERVPPLRYGGRQHLERSARWQVGDEDWASFLDRECLQDATAHNVRSQILDQLRFVGIEPRPGMQSV